MCMARKTVTVCAKFETNYCRCNYQFIALVNNQKYLALLLSLKPSLHYFSHLEHYILEQVSVVATVRRMFFPILRLMKIRKDDGVSEAGVWYNKHESLICKYFSSWLMGSVQEAGRLEHVSKGPRLNLWDFYWIGLMPVLVGFELIIANGENRRTTSDDVSYDMH